MDLDERPSKTMTPQATAASDRQMPLRPARAPGATSDDDHRRASLVAVEGTVPEQGELSSHLRRALEIADERAQRRLGQAGTSVTLEVIGAESQSVTILLDRVPPEVVGGDEPAEISIALTTEQAHSFAIGELRLPALLAAGEIGFRGPARKYLAVDPILRHLLSRTPRQDHVH